MPETMTGAEYDAREWLSMTEAEFLARVIHEAQERGWLVFHARPARTAQGYRTAVQGDGAGFPDLVMVRPPVVLVAELKSEKGRVGQAQKRWLEKLWDCRGAFLAVYVWRPSNREFILEVLQ